MCQDQNTPVEALNRSQRSVDYNIPINPIRSSTVEFSNQRKVRDDRHTDSVTSMPYNQIVSDRPTYYDNNAIKKNASSLSDVARSQSKSMTNLPLDFNKRQLYMTTERETSSDHGSITWSELRARRLERTKRGSKEQRSVKKNEKQRQSNKESEKQQQNEENGKMQRQNETNEGQEISERNRTRRHIKKKGKKRRQNGRRRQRENNRRQSSTFSLSILILISPACD